MAAGRWYLIYRKRLYWRNEKFGKADYYFIR
jgi:hypothetical protein